MHGRGVYVHKDTDNVYDGEYKDNFRHGYGQLRPCQAVECGLPGWAWRRQRKNILCAGFVSGITTSAAVANL